MIDENKEYLDYWSVVYCTTQSEAMRQKAADILRGNNQQLPEKKKMKVKYDQFTQKYFIYHSESNIVAMSFEELENFSQQLHQIVTDEYSRVLQIGLDLEGMDCEGGGCKI